MPIRGVKPALKRLWLSVFSWDLGSCWPMAAAVHLAALSLEPDVVALDPCIHRALHAGMLLCQGADAARRQQVDRVPPRFRRDQQLQGTEEGRRSASLSRGSPSREPVE